MGACLLFSTRLLFSPHMVDAKDFISLLKCGASTFKTHVSKLNKIFQNVCTHLPWYSSMCLEREALRDSVAIPAYQFAFRHFHRLHSAWKKSGSAGQRWSATANKRWKALAEHSYVFSQSHLRPISSTPTSLSM